MQPSERVILIKGDATKWYDQAIFIVNKDLPPDKIPVDFVAEAERIINSYIQKKKGQAGGAPAVYDKRPPNAAKKPAPRAYVNKGFDRVLNAVMLLGCIAIAAALAFGLLA